MLALLIIMSGCYIVGFPLNKTQILLVTNVVSVVLFPLLTFKKKCQQFLQPEFFSGGCLFFVHGHVISKRCTKSWDKAFLCHSSQFLCLCLTKSSSEMLQNLPYFWDTKTHIVFSFFILGKKNKVAWNEKWKQQLWVSFCQKYSKFWSISLELFVEHKPSIWEEW